MILTLLFMIAVAIASIVNSYLVLRRDAEFCKGFAKRHNLKTVPANVGECIAMCREGRI